MKTYLLLVFTLASDFTSTPPSKLVLPLFLWCRWRGSWSLFLCRLILPSLSISYHQQWFLPWFSQCRRFLQCCWSPYGHWLRHLPVCCFRLWLQKQRSCRRIGVGLFAGVGFSLGIHTGTGFGSTDDVDLFLYSGIRCMGYTNGHLRKRKGTDQGAGKYQKCLFKRLRDQKALLRVKSKICARLSRCGYVSRRDERIEGKYVLWILKVENFFTSVQALARNTGCWLLCVQHPVYSLPTPPNKNRLVFFSITETLLLQA